MVKCILNIYPSFESALTGFYFCTVCMAHDPSHIYSKDEVKTINRCECVCLSLFVCDTLVTCRTHVSTKRTDYSVPCWLAPSFKLNVAHSEWWKFLRLQHFSRHLTARRSWAWFFKDVFFWHFCLIWQSVARDRKHGERGMWHATKVCRHNWTVECCGHSFLVCVLASRLLGCPRL